MKKRVVSILMAAMMAVSVLAGCGGSSSDKGNAAQGGTENAEEQGNASAETEEPYNVVMQIPVIGDTPAGLADVEAAINEITSEAINVTVTLQPAGAFNLANETSLAVSSGQKLDLCLSLFSGIGALVDSGSIIPLDDLIAEYGQDISATCEETIKGGMYNNSLYAVPTAYIKGNDASFVARKDILDKYNITIDPDKYYTMEELEEIFATVQNGEGAGFHIMAGGFSSTDLPFGMAGVAVDTLGGGTGILFDAQGNALTEIVSYYESEEYKAYAERMYDWAQKGYFSADAATTTEVANAQMATGNYLGCFANENIGITTAEYSVMVGSECVTIKTGEAIVCTSGFQSVLWSIPTTCENPEKTMQFLNMLYNTPELCNLLMYGIEGVSYEVVESDENGTVISKIEGAPYSMDFGVFGNRYSWHVVAPNTTTTNRDLKEFSDAIDNFSPALGFVPTFTNVSTEYSAVSAVIAQYIPIINTGSIDPAVELPEFIQALKDAGIDTVLAEVQAQYEEFQAAQ